MFRKELVSAIAMAGVGENIADSLLEVPAQKEMGDFALPCFKLAGQYKKPPFEIAKELAAKIRLPGVFARMETKGAYINFFVSKQANAGHALSSLLKKPEKARKGGRVLLEYCGANPMKAFHIGHVRNITIGEAIARLREAVGEKVTRIYYGGDVGPHVSKVLYAYRNLRHAPEPKSPREKEKWLGALYAAGSEAVKQNPDLEAKMKEMVVALEKRADRKMLADWKRLRKTSLQCFERIFRENGIRFDRTIMESDVEKEGIRIAGRLLRQGIAIKHDGAILMNLEEHGLGKFLILKSDGAALYSSKDIALAKLKKKEYRPEKSYYLVGAEQTFYFRQLTKAIELLNGVKNEYSPVTHIPYELVRLEGAKMSSREGNVITYDEFFGTVLGKTAAETRQRHPEWSEKRLSETAKIIALASIKFGMLNHDMSKVITFNWEKATSLEGETGPFMLYSYARARSILRKAGKFTAPKIFSFPTEKENTLASMLGELGKKTKEAAQANSPNTMARHLMDICSEFNSFYHEVPILQGEKGMLTQRLALVKAFTAAVERGASLLNMELLEEM